jgi:hypothetical protein
LSFLDVDVDVDVLVPVCTCPSITSAGILIYCGLAQAHARPCAVPHRPPDSRTGTGLAMIDSLSISLCLQYGSDVDVDEMDQRFLLTTNIH